MSREVRFDGMGQLEVRFAFDRALVDLIKTLPRRRWNAEGRFWSVPEEDVVLLVELLEPRRFQFDDGTRRAYETGGGRLSLTPRTLVRTLTPALPGLFDEVEAGSPPPGSAGTSPEDFTVSRLNECVRDVLAEAFPLPLWLVGEISGFNRNAHKRHVTFQFDEKGEEGRTVSSVGATLFEGTRRDIERALVAAGDPFRLEDEVTVRARVRVDLHVPWGSYRVVVEELDLRYTLGEAARRREEIVRRLTEEGLVGRNLALPMPALPLAIGLVTSLGSDAYNDVLRTLEESGFAFTVVAHGARVQGHATEPSVLNALDALRERAAELDCVLICRGGGSRTDLAWFDSLALGRAVARFPLPVVIGIGHEQDRSVLDEVGRRAKTPTAAAALLVETVRLALERVLTLEAEARGAAARSILAERRRGLECYGRLARATRGALRAALDRMRRFLRDVPRAGAVHLARERASLDHARRAVAQGARRDLVSARTRASGVGRTLPAAARRCLVAARERDEARDRRLHLVDPRRVVERGYAVLRGQDGGVIQDAARVPEGASLSAELKRGRLRLRSEGPAQDEGGS